MAYKYPICDVFHWFCKIARFFVTEPKTVLSKARIAFLDKYAYSRLFNTCTGDKNCIHGEFDQKYLQDLVRREFRNIEFDYSARDRPPRQLAGLRAGSRLNFYGYYLIFHNPPFEWLKTP
jgi:hypothetical protein